MRQTAKALIEAHPSYVDNITLAQETRGRRLGHMLAQGGMGSVWVAKHLQLDVEVAIKLMVPEYADSGDARARFEREAKASAQLKGSNVVHVHDYGMEGDSPYIVMELLEGEDLAAKLWRERRLTIEATANIIHQVCKALRRAHEMGLVHRDLKPGNIFLAREGGEEVVKVLDFGIAKATGPLLAGMATKTGTLLGSPYYMSPEQMRRSKQVDQRSDIWSLGVILFQCLTGRIPFSGDELGDLIVAICSDPIPRPSQIAGDLGPDVDQLILRALTRDPAGRFQSVEELAEALAALQGHRAPASWPPARAVTEIQTPAPAPALTNNTLAPSGQSVAPPPNRAWQVGLALFAILGVVLGLCALLLFLRSPSHARPAAVPLESALPPIAPPPLVSPTASLRAPGAEPSESAPPSPPSASAAAKPAPRPPGKSPPSPPGTAVPQNPPRRTNDPLNQM